MFHPDPQKGAVIGKIVKTLPNTDISLLQLNAGLRYVNQTFGSDEDPAGITIPTLSLGDPLIEELGTWTVLLREDARAKC